MARDASKSEYETHCTVSNVRKNFAAVRYCHVMGEKRFLIKKKRGHDSLVQCRTCCFVILLFKNVQSISCVTKTIIEFQLELSIRYDKHYL